MTSTIQRTSKRLKLLQLAAHTALLLGASVYLFADAEFGLWLAAAGASTLALARVAIWWQHG